MLLKIFLHLLFINIRTISNLDCRMIKFSLKENTYHVIIDLFIHISYSIKNISHLLLIRVKSN